MGILAEVNVMRDKLEATLREQEKVQGKRYHTLGDITSEYYRPTIDKLIHKGVLKGKGGDGEDTEIDLSEDAVRLLVILDRTGLFE